MRSLLQLALVMSTLGPLAARAETAEENIARATAAVAAAAPRAQADPAHPTFHVASPGQWMNDPNGPIFYQGCYHLFYQLNPYSDGDGPKYWGHVRSRDLVKWEPLPVAIAPSNDQGEEAIWSGCCTINGLGQPMAFYTSIGFHKSAFDQAVQWAALGDQALVHWQKSPANPVLSDATNEGKKIYDWRDPFIFKTANRTFLVTGGHLGREGQAAVSIYEAVNPEFTQWKYRGTLFQHPDAGTPTVECPNFFQVGHQWVLFVSPYNHVQYFVGDFDATTCKFTAHSRGLADYGTFYAPNTMQLPNGRRLVWGWLNGFPGGRGWNGCLSLPRQLSLAADGQLVQEPAPQLSKLRGRAVSWEGTRLNASAQSVVLPATNALEIQADISLTSPQPLELEIKGPAADAKPVTIRYEGGELAVLDSKAPLPLSGPVRQLKLRVFIDHSVLEVFANGTVCLTRVIPTLEAGATLSVRAAGQAQVKRLRAWPMNSIW